MWKRNPFSCYSFGIGFLNCIRNVTIFGFTHAYLAHLRLYSLFSNLVLFYFDPTQCDLWWGVESIESYNFCPICLWKFNEVLTIVLIVISCKSELYHDSENSSSFLSSFTPICPEKLRTKSALIRHYKICLRLVVPCTEYKHSCKTLTYLCHFIEEK